MSYLLNRLRALPRKINVGIVGIGSIGKGLVYQSHITPGMDCVAIADIKIERAIACAQWLGRDYRIVRNGEAMSQAIRSGDLAICEDGLLIAQCGLVDVLIESSNAIETGARTAIAALENRRHVVMMNSEADLMFGPLLLKTANENGTVYTSADGDQPAVVKHLIDEITLWGFELVMAGNIKGYLDRYVTPSTIIPEADKRKLDYRMCTSYTDGTKLNIEMALVANSIGARAAVPGMYGPRAKEVHDVFDLFDLTALWKDKQPMVDYILGAKPTGGVFVIGYTDRQYQQETLAWFPPEMGPGPFYVFYRPYHLGHIEAISCVAHAFLDKRPVLQPDFGFRTNVYAYAKRDLHAGERLDGIGGYTCYGLIEDCAPDDHPEGLPICLADGVTLNDEIKKNEKILMTQVSFGSQRSDLELYRKAEECSRRVS